MRKRLLALLLGGALLFGCTGCVQSVQTLAGAAEETEQPAEVERVNRIGIPYRADSTLNPLAAENEFNFEASLLIYDCLYDVDENFAATPKLATASTADGVNYTLLLREGVRFHDGSELTSDDVVATLNRVKNTESSPYHARMAHVKTVEASGTHAVNITLDRVDYRFPACLNIPIVKDGSVKDGAAGSGRYRPEGETLVANEDWAFRTGEFSIGTVDLVNIEDYDALVDQAGTGEISAFKLTDEDFSRVSLPGGFASKAIATNELVYLGVNLKNRHLGAAEFRRALSLSVDRGEILEDVLQKNGYVTQSIINPSYQYFSTAAAAQFGAEKADSLLTALGYTYGGNGALLSGGEQVSLRLVAPEGSLGAVAERVTAQLTEAGIAVELSLLPASEYRTALSRKNFDLYLAECKLSPDMDAGVLVGSGAALNYGGYASEEMDAAVQAVREAADEETLRAAVSAEVTLTARDMPVVPLYFNTATLLTRQKYGLQMNPTPYGFFTGLEVS